jgi:hypothetical protein
MAEASIKFKENSRLYNFKLEEMVNNNMLNPNSQGLSSLGEVIDFQEAAITELEPQVTILPFDNVREESEMKNPQIIAQLQKVENIIHNQSRKLALKYKSPKIIPEVEKMLENSNFYESSDDLIINIQDNVLNTKQILPEMINTGRDCHTLPTITRAEVLNKQSIPSLKIQPISHPEEKLIHPIQQPIDRYASLTITEFLSQKGLKFIEPNATKIRFWNPSYSE